jgi:hypothetical protein
VEEPSSHYIHIFAQLGRQIQVQYEWLDRKYSQSRTIHQTKEDQQQTESADVRVDLGREDRPPIEVQLDRGESTCTDDADVRNVRKISDNSSSGISVTSSEHITICPSDFCSNDYTGRSMCWLHGHDKLQLGPFHETFS